MPKALVALNVLIASPSDVTEERDTARTVIERWNATNALSRGIVLIPFGWEKNCWPSLGGRPQQIVNEQIVELSDFAIAIFHTKLGTPTGGYVSGTDEEINLLLNANKHVMVYWSKAPLPPDQVSPQFEQLKEYLNKLRGTGLVDEYQERSEFAKKLREHLDMYINSLSISSPGASAPTAPKPWNEVLSVPAQKILCSAAMKRGDIHELRADGYHIVQVGGELIGQEENPRSLIEGVSALRDLVERGLVSREGRALLQLTAEGYKVADELIKAQIPSA